jgi:hypothetical protein
MFNFYFGGPGLWCMRGLEGVLFFAVYSALHLQNCAKTQGESEETTCIPFKNISVNLCYN